MDSSPASLRCHESVWNQELWSPGEISHFPTYFLWLIQCLLHLHSQTWIGTATGSRTGTSRFIRRRYIKQADLQACSNKAGTTCTFRSKTHQADFGAQVWFLQNTKLGRNPQKGYIRLFWPQGRGFGVLTPRRSCVDLLCCAFPGKFWTGATNLCWKLKHLALSMLLWFGLSWLFAV